MNALAMQSSLTPRFALADKSVRPSGAVLLLLCCATAATNWHDNVRHDSSQLWVRDAGSQGGRGCLVVRAAAQESRRQVLSGLVASVVSLTALGASAQVDLDDERKVRQRGFDLIYEARDLDLDQSTRDGLTQYRTNIDSTRARVKEAENIIDNKLEPFIKKKYWTEAREDLRNQVGNLRFDLNTLIEKSSKSKADKKAATQLKKDFLIKVEEFDYFIRKKDQGKAETGLAEAKTALDKVLSAVA